MGPAGQGRVQDAQKEQCQQVGGYSSGTEHGQEERQVGLANSHGRACLVGERRANTYYHMYSVYCTVHHVDQQIWVSWAGSSERQPVVCCTAFAESSCGAELRAGASSSVDGLGVCALVSAPVASRACVSGCPMREGERSDWLRLAVRVRDDATQYPEGRESSW